MLLLDTNYFFSIDQPDYLLAILNSKLITYWINSKDTPIGDGGAYRHYKYNLEKLSIPKESIQLQVGKQSEEEINKIVCNLYGLTTAETDFILSQQNQ